MEEEIVTLRELYSDGTVKKEINQLLWRYLHPETTIGEAEEHAAKAHEMMENLFIKVEGCGIKGN